MDMNNLKPFFIQEIAPKKFAVMNGSDRGCRFGVYKTTRAAKAGLEWAKKNPELASYYTGDSLNATQYDVATRGARVVNLG